MVIAAARFLPGHVYVSGVIRAKLRVGTPGPAVVVFRSRAQDHRLVRMQTADTNAHLFIHKSGIRQNLEPGIMSGWIAVSDGSPLNFASDWL